MTFTLGIVLNKQDLLEKSCNTQNNQLFESILSYLLTPHSCNLQELLNNACFSFSLLIFYSTYIVVKVLFFSAKPNLEAE